MNKAGLSSAFCFSVIIVCVVSVIPTRAQRVLNETRQERAIRTDSYNRAVDNLSGKIATPAAAGMGRRPNRPLDQDFRKAVLATQVAITGKIVGIVDGDTVYLRINDRVKLVRLIGADAPDLGQSKYEEAMEFLKQCLLDRDVTVHYSTYGLWDLDGLPLVTISDGDAADIGLRLIENGMAWYDEADQFYLSKTTADLYKAKTKEAKDKKTGIWSEQSPEKPWEYRDRIRRDERKKAAAKKS